jgi:hypothetical protein
MIAKSKDYFLVYDKVIYESLKKRIRTEVSNPGPGALSSLRIPTSIDYDYNKKTKQD